MNEKYWDEKFNLLFPMFHNNEVNGGEDRDDIILHLKQIAADQRKACAIKLIHVLQTTDNIDDVHEAILSAEIT